MGFSQLSTRCTCPAPTPSWEGKPGGDSIGIMAVCEGVKRAELRHLPAVRAFYFRSKTFFLTDGAQMKALHWMIRWDAATVAQHSASFSKCIYKQHVAFGLSRCGTHKHAGCSPRGTSALPISATRSSPLCQPKSLPKAVGSTSRSDPTVPRPVFRGALPVSGPSHTSSSACQSSIPASSTPGKQA